MIGHDNKLINFDKGIMCGNFFPEIISNFTNFRKNQDFAKIIYTVFGANGNEIISMRSIIISLKSGGFGTIFVLKFCDCYFFRQ